MKTAIYVEIKKLRTKKVWLTVAALIVIQFLWVLWSLGRMDAQDMAQGWMLCLYQFPLLNTIMMPVVAAVIASQLCDIEHKGNTLKLLETVMPSGRLFDAKFLVSALYILAAVLLQAGSIAALGSIKGFTYSVPLTKLFQYGVFTLVVGLTLLLFQVILSLLFTHQVVPFIVGLVGGLAGLYSLFFPAAINRLLLWGYYGVLMQVGMDWEPATRVVDYYYLPIDWPGVITIIAVFSALYFIGRILYQKKEV
ncbi:MAG: ABC transporter permease [Eubacteriales bacterium]